MNESEYKVLGFLVDQTVLATSELLDLDAKEAIPMKAQAVLAAVSKLKKLGLIAPCEPKMTRYVRYSTTHTGHKAFITECGRMSHLSYWGRRKFSEDDSDLEDEIDEENQNKAVKAFLKDGWIFCFKEDEVPLCKKCVDVANKADRARKRNPRQ